MGRGARSGRVRGALRRSARRTDGGRGGVTHADQRNLSGRFLAIRERGANRGGRARRVDERRRQSASGADGGRRRGSGRPRGDGGGGGTSGREGRRDGGIVWRVDAGARGDGDGG